jgi:uridine kinase
MPRPASFAAAVAEVARLADRLPTRTRFVGVDGRGGSGKSTLAASIAATVAGAVVVHVDDFAGPHVPEWDWARLQDQVVDPLLAGRPGHYQRYDWDRDEGAEWHDVATGRVVVIEGVSSTRRELDVPWALQIWVAAPRDLRLRRAVERDGEAMRSHWVDVWMPSEEAYIARERPEQRVDLVVSVTE